MPLFRRSMSLFHARVVEKLHEQPLDIPPTHEAILRDWAKSIEDRTIYNQHETALHSNFKEKIINQILGYQPFNNSLSHYDVFSEFPIAGTRVDLALGIFDPHNKQEPQCFAPFELKGAKTNLDAIMPGRHKTPVQQAWDYAMDAKGAQWVLVSNYLEIRLYAVGHGRQNYEYFDLATLHEPREYTRFYKILSKENLLGGYTRDLLKKSEQQDKDITNRLYQDYKIIRSNLFHNIMEHNPGITNHNAISYAQTILDRVLFIAFAEDKDLLPENSLKMAYEFQNPFERERKPIWETFKALFSSINAGNNQLGIPKYNGGLFAEDKDIDSLKLPDSIFGGFKKLGDYNYKTEVSVNILGHIFEQSITDIEEFQKIDDLSIKNKSGKRKKEGVVYTPDFITRFIAEQALGGYLEQRRKELEQSKPDWFLKTGEKKGEFKTEKAELEYWLAWQKQLKKIKVVDPACGSGAFLVAAFDYLHDEYRRVSDRLTLLRGGKSDFWDLDSEILTNNLYGVDINSESIEITKLSLWLKTAKRGKVLDTLDQNYRWGDSVIEDSNYSARAFTWKEAFPDIFEDEGFDVVLGNPPYVRQEFITHLKPYLQTRFDVYEGTIDLYSYFLELGLRILKPSGKLGYICSSTFFKTGGGENVRVFLKKNSTLNAIVDFGDLQVFEGVTTYPVILIMEKQLANENHSLTYLKIKDMPDDLNQEIQNKGQLLLQNKLEDDSWHLEGSDTQVLRKKITVGYKNLKEVYGSLFRGVLTGLNEAFVIDGTVQQKLIREDKNSANLIKPFLEGKDLQKWHLECRDLFLILIPKGFTKAKSNAQDEETAWKWLSSEYPAIANHLERFKEPAKKRGDKGDFWWELRACDYYTEFEKPKIIYPDMSQGPKFIWDKENKFFSNTSYFISKSDLFLLGLLNSKVCWFYLRGVCEALRGGTWRLRLFSINIETIPIPNANDKQKNILGDLAYSCQTLASERYEIQEKVCKRFSDFSSPNWDGKLGKKLNHWWELDRKAFQAEIKKVFKKDILLAERDDWDDYISKYKKQVEELTKRIEQLEEELNKTVYGLFNLTTEEIKMVEENI